LIKQKTLKGYIFFSLIFSTNLLFAKNVDVHDFDISGIKLGMTKQESIKILISKYDVSKKDLINKFSPQIIAYRKTPIEIVVSFDRESMEAEVITYKLPWSKENKTSMKAMAIKKYGEPTVDKSQLAGEVSWCLKPKKQMMNMGYSCTMSNSAYLGLSSTEIRLYEPKYKQERLQKMKEKNNIIPSF